MARKESHVGSTGALTDGSSSSADTVSIDTRTIRGAVRTRGDVPTWVLDTGFGEIETVKLWNIRTKSV
jgi:hypothetical protein